MQRRALAALVCSVAVVCAAVLAGCGDAPPAPAKSLGTAFDRPVPQSVLDLPLTTARGQHTNLAAYHGKIVVLGDFLTLCSEICPMTSANFVQMARSARAAGNVAFLEVTVDPQRDTPARLAAYRAQFGAPGNWVLATGSPAGLARLWRYFGVFYQRTKEDQPAATDWLTGAPLSYDVAHQDAVIFLDQRGHERFLILGNPDARGEPVSSTLQRFLSNEGHRNLSDPGQAAWSPRDGLSVVSWLAGHHVGGGAS